MKSALVSMCLVHGIITAYENPLITPWRKFYGIDLMFHGNITEKSLHFDSIYLY